jgi:trimethylamine--corrinoid protein Co-methyltransferase
LRFAEGSLKILVEAARHGMHGAVTTSGQAGSTAPTALAGAIVQSVAEMLGIVAIVNFVKRGHPVNFAAWPFVTDLRSGNFSGGSGEQAVLAAACAQISNEFYRLPSNVGAGMTDSKLPDAQAGFEKGVTVALAAHAGANFISEAAGMMGSLLGFSLEGLVIDNDMLGMIQRTVRGIEVTDETLSLEVIRDTVLGDGHFLVHPQTLALMQSEYTYPEILDRESTRSWEKAGAPELRARAAERVRDILSTHYPTYIESAIEEKIRDRFPILLDKAHMKSGNERW